MASARHYFLTRFTFDARRDAVWREICSFLQKRHIPPESRILDLGAGYCHFINNILGKEKHALDISDIILEYARQNVITHVQSCTTLDGFGDDLLDVVFASNIFEHLGRDELSKALCEVRRVLRPDGRLIVIQPNFKYCHRAYFDDYTHMQIFTHIGLCDLLMSSGFTIRGVKPRFLPFSAKSKWPKSPVLVKLYLHSPFKPFAGQMLIVAENRKLGA